MSSYIIAGSADSIETAYVFFIYKNSVNKQLVVLGPNIKTLIFVQL